jgi:choline dehydrogenase-like flavoprotein
VAATVEECGLGEAMKSVLVVGSGASGVHFALSALRKGYQVTMLDVGWERPSAVNPEDTLDELKEHLADPVQYFLGDGIESLILPGEGASYLTRYYGIPPSKSYVFRSPGSLVCEANGMEPSMSFAKGGLAEAWTGGAYPLNDDELGRFPFGYKEIEQYYEEVTRRIGINGAADDLSRFFPVQKSLVPPLQLDENSQSLLARYQSKSGQMTKKYRVHVGRSRVATLSSDRDGRRGCTYCGRCLWGCPNGALYAPSCTLHECLPFANFRYVPGVLASHLEVDGRQHLGGIVAESVLDGQLRTFQADTYVLAAGTLSSSKIFLDTLYRASGEIATLSGLMDNRQVLVPFCNLHRVGGKYEGDRYQYHQLAVGLEMGDPAEYVHGQITTLKTAQIHPLLQLMPLDFHSAIQVFKLLQPSLAVINLSFPDTRRPENFLSIAPLSGDPGRTKMEVNYRASEGQARDIRAVLGRLTRALATVGSIVLPGMAIVRPMGASLHYSGTLAMSDRPEPLRTSKLCQSYDFENLYVVDGSVIPSLPAKNITLTLMANAIRVAEEAF